MAPTRPLDQDWAAIHSTVSNPSVPAVWLTVWKYWPVPSERCLPRRSCNTSTYPLGVKQSATSSMSHSACLS